MLASDYLANLQRKQQAYMYFPSHVHIETVGACNAKCVFCPNSIMDRRSKQMSDELFDKIVGDLKQIPYDRPLAISPSKVNEPLLDKKIFDRIDQLAEALPNATFWFTTNLSLATPDVLEQLAQVPRLGYIWVSLHSLQEDEYHQWTGLSLKKTVQNVKRLLQLNREKQFTPTIFLGRVKDNSPHDKQFFTDVQTVLADFEYDVEYKPAGLRRGQWLGFTESDADRVPDYPCIRWFELSITCTGEVAFCCMDGLSQYPLGDVNQQGILEIYNQPVCMERRRQIPPRCDEEVCRDCTFL